MLPAGSGSGSGDYGSGSGSGNYGSGSGSGDYGSGYDDCNLSQCFLEYDVQYKVELADMKNLNADDADKKQSSMEECRTFCRYINNQDSHNFSS